MIVAPIIVVLLLCIGGIAVGIYCCCKPGGCCNPEKKKPAVEMTTPAACEDDPSLKNAVAVARGRATGARPAPNVRGVGAGEGPY